MLHIDISDRYIALKDYHAIFPFRFVINLHEIQFCTEISTFLRLNVISN